MSDLRQGLFGLLSAALSAVIILGSFALSMTEGNLRLALAPTPTAQFGQSNPPFPALATPLPGDQAFTPTESNPQSLPPLAQAPASTSTAQSGPVNLVPTAGESPTPPPPPPPMACPQPGGWNAVTVQPGDTLRSLANKYDLDPAELAAQNCLVTETLLSGTTLFVPGRQAAQPTQRCGPPAGWVYYTIRRGDTLYRLSSLLGVTVHQLQQANCLGNRTVIRVGQQIFVPFLPAPPATIPPTRTQPPPPPAPTTQAPTTQVPTTQAPPAATTPPANTQPPMTVAPTEPPANTPKPATPVPTIEPTQPPRTEPPPVTEPPVTNPPTEPPVTQPPVTEPPRPTLEP